MVEGTRWASTLDLKITLELGYSPRGKVGR